MFSWLCKFSLFTGMLSLNANNLRAYTPTWAPRQVFQSNETECEVEHTVERTNALQNWLSIFSESLS